MMLKSIVLVFTLIPISTNARNGIDKSQLDLFALVDAIRVLIFVGMIGMVGSLVLYVVYLVWRNEALLKSLKHLGSICVICTLCGIGAAVYYSPLVVRQGNFEGLDDETVDFKEVDLDGWNVFTTDGGKFLSITKDGTKILNIMEDGFAIRSDSGLGRTITIHSEKIGITGVLTLYDEDSDTNYNLMQLSTGEKEFSDRGLDGITDVVIEWETLNLEVNYQGKLHPVIKEGENKYISVDGQKIEAKRDGLLWAVIADSHNKEGN